MTCDIVVRIQGAMACVLTLSDVMHQRRGSAEFVLPLFCVGYVMRIAGLPMAEGAGSGGRIVVRPDAGPDDQNGPSTTSTIRAQVVQTRLFFGWLWCLDR